MLSSRDLGVTSSTQTQTLRTGVERDAVIAGVVQPIAALDTTLRAAGLPPINETKLTADSQRQPDEQRFPLRTTPKRASLNR